MFSSVFISTGVKNLIIISGLIFVAGITAGYAVGKEVQQEIETSSTAHAAVK